METLYTFFVDPARESTTPCSSQDIPNPYLPKQGSPFYAEPADSLMPVHLPANTKSSEILTNNSISPLQSFRLVNFRVKPDREDNEGINI